MNHVRILSENVANLIAAGEVVERPASVLKELIENALDAEARHIEIEASHSGFSFLRVVDDGCGMEPDDARLAFTRHATSKLSSAEDLQSIVSFGFRGEALPAMAAVSKVELLTRPSHLDFGFQLKIEGGDILEGGQTGSACGTSVTVRDLFYNTPARRKFMKSPATEQAHLIQVVEWYALANSSIGFKFTLDGQPQALCSPTDSLEERLRDWYGKALPSPLIRVSRKAGEISAWGLVADPVHARPARQNMHIFINRRPIEHRGLTHAVIEAFKPQILPGRYPMCFLFLAVPPHLVDVNVHPAKREVRFKDEHAMHDFLLSSIREGLQKSQPVYGAPPATGFGWSPEKVREAVGAYVSENAGVAGPKREPVVSQPDLEQEGQITIEQGPSRDRVLGQVGRTYIAAQNQAGFFLADQHALHERLLFEELKSLDRPLPRQQLLLPLTLELSPARAALMPEIIPVFSRLGIDISGFGKNAFVIQTQPQLWGHGDLKALVVEFVEWVSEQGRPPSTDDLWRHGMQTMACHAAVKAGDRLQPEVMESLVSRIPEIPLPLTCPHGRPLLYRLSWQELDRLFKRI